MAENKDAAVLRAEGRSELHNRQRRIASRLTNRCLPVTYREFEVLEDTQKIRCLVCNNGKLYGFPKLTRKQEEDGTDPVCRWARLSGKQHLNTGGHAEKRLSGIERLIKEAGARLPAPMPLPQHVKPARKKPRIKPPEAAVRNQQTVAEALQAAVAVVAEANRRGRAGQRGFNCFRVCEKEGGKIVRCLCAGPSIWHDSGPKALQVTLPPTNGADWLKYALGVHAGAAFHQQWEEYERNPKEQPTMMRFFGAPVPGQQLVASPTRDDSPQLQLQCMGPEATPSHTQPH